MGVFGSPKKPTPPPPPEESPPIPTVADTSVIDRRIRSRRRASLSSGRNSTVLTSGLGLPGNAATTKTALGV